MTDTPSTPESETEADTVSVRDALEEWAGMDGVSGAQRSVLMAAVEQMRNDLDRKVWLMLEIDRLRRTPTEPPADRDAVAEILDVIERLREPRHKYASAEAIAQRLEEVLALLRPEGQEPDEGVEEFYGLVIEEWNEAGENRMEIAYNLCEPVASEDERWVILRPPPGFKMASHPAPEAASFAEMEAADLRARMAEITEILWPGDREWADAPPKPSHIVETIRTRLAAPEARPEGERIERKWHETFYGPQKDEGHVGDHGAGEGVRRRSGATTGARTRRLRDGTNGDTQDEDG